MHVAGIVNYVSVTFVRLSFCSAVGCSAPTPTQGQGHGQGEPRVRRLIQTRYPSSRLRSVASAVRQGRSRMSVDSAEHVE